MLKGLFELTAKVGSEEYLAKSAADVRATIHILNNDTSDYYSVL